MTITIASWIVLDQPENATAFPSAGRDSAAAAFQRVYWHCLGLYFLTARVHNPDVPLMLYANADPDVAAPPDVRAVLQRLGVVSRKIDITLRLPRGTVSSFGNQFYVLDVIRDFARQGTTDALVLTDSDCIWRRSVRDMETALRSNECLLYTLAPADQKGYEVGRLLNGMTHARMSDIARREFGLPADHQVQYHGGEFFAATRTFCQRIQPHVAKLWQVAIKEAARTDAIKEEAHFLSILTEGLGVAPWTANAFVRRIWTNFEDLNALPTDNDLALWHLPSEKRFGFRRLWQHVSTSQRDLLSLTPDEFNRLTTNYMGVPKRTAGKLIQDVTQKVLARAFPMA
jgi:hypothetical protein